LNSGCSFESRTVRYGAQLTIKYGNSQVREDATAMDVKSVNGSRSQPESSVDERETALEKPENSQPDQPKKKKNLRQEALASMA
jgi:hypothetical protein